jgi:transketolase
LEVAGDGNDMKAFEKALKKAKKENRPTMIKLRTHIAYGSPNKQDTAGAHGAPLGEDEIKLVKQRFGWDPDKSFVVPEEVLAHMRKALGRGKRAETKWSKMFEKYTQAYPELARQFRDAAEGNIGMNLDEILPQFEPGSSMATRKASGKTLEALMPRLPLVLAGSADLTPSNVTKFTGAEDFQKQTRNGRYIRYGVREHAMATVMNGISTSGLARAYGGTFLVFSDYMRPAIRLAALSKYPTIFVFTHDSIGVGEDGPTHQPVEHVAALRTIPNLLVIRPADANETAQAWKTNLNKGAYVLAGAEDPDVLLLATGSEVSVALCAAEGLQAQGIKVQVVSMPCWELFEMQSQQYKDSVLPPAVKSRVGIEAGVEEGWYKYLGDNGIFVGMSSFGASAPAKVCFEKFGITADAVIQAANKSMSGR